ncbi:MAG: ZIP family metal transporter, partial [Candidatus Bathyarchaeia archaeon]
MLVLLANENPILLSFIGGVILAAFNAVGALPVLFFKKVSQKFLDIGLGFAAGVMLTASFTSLIIPSIKMGSIFPVIVGISIGATIVMLADRIIPHMHFIIGYENPISAKLKAIWLFAIAVTLHNMPEGLVVGIGLGSKEIKAAMSLMLAIGIQNVPEGLSVGFSLLTTKEYSRLKSYLVSVGSGLIEVPLSLLGAWTVVTFEALLPYAMG